MVFVAFYSFKCIILPIQLLQYIRTNFTRNVTVLCIKLSMLATRRGEKKLTRKVMMLQTIEAEQFQGEAKRVTGSLSRAQPQDKKKTHRTELTRVYCSDPRPVRLSICHCDQWERLSRLSPSGFPAI